MLGEFLAFRYSKDVLLVDMDAQANLSYCMVPDHQIERQEHEGRTTYHLLRAGFRDSPLSVEDYITQPPLVVSNISRGMMATPGTTLHMVISTPTVAELDENLMQLWEQGQRMPQQVRHSISRAIEPVRNEYDYILIDCPPGLSLFSSAALIASDYYISPIIPEPLSLQGVQLVQERQAQLMQEYDSKAEFKGVVLNIVKHYRTTHSRVSNRLYGHEVSRFDPFEYWLPDNEKLRKLGEYDPDIEGPWAIGMESKFSDIHHKYGLTYRLTNPAEGSLSRQEEEGRQYRLEDRISRLTQEFMERCPTEIE